MYPVDLNKFVTEEPAASKGGDAECIKLKWTR